MDTKYYIQETYFSAIKKHSHDVVVEKMTWFCKEEIAEIGNKEFTKIIDWCQQKVLAKV
jgi:hypothetical protein